MGFSARRKTLANNLSAGLQISKKEVEALLEKAGMPSSIRAQELDVDAWKKLSCVIGQAFVQE